MECSRLRTVTNKTYCYGVQQYDTSRRLGLCQSRKEGLEGCCSRDRLSPHPIPLEALPIRNNAQKPRDIESISDRRGRSL